MDLRALVTGPAGQVGMHLVDLLRSRGVQVVALHRVPPESNARRLSDAGHLTVIGDILNGQFLKSLLAAQAVDVVFHLAALNAMNEPENAYLVNVVGTATLLSALRQSALIGARLILVSSSAVYGASKNDPIDETSPLVPETNYGISKLAMEHMGGVHGNETGRDVLIARPFNIVGPSQRAPLLYARVAQQLAEIASGSRPPVLELGNLENFRDFIDVRDVCAGLFSIFQYGEPGQAYNLCSGRSTQVARLVEKLCELSGQNIEIRSTSRATVTLDVPYQRGSHEKLTRVSGWHPKIPLEKSLADTLAYWQSIVSSPK